MCYVNMDKIAQFIVGLILIVYVTTIIYSIIRFEECGEVNDGEVEMGMIDPKHMKNFAIAANIILLIALVAVFVGFKSGKTNLKRASSVILCLGVFLSLMYFIIIIFGKAFSPEVCYGEKYNDVDKEDLQKLEDMNNFMYVILGSIITAALLAVAFLRSDYGKDAKVKMEQQFGAMKNAAGKWRTNINTWKNSRKPKPSEGGGGWNKVRAKFKNGSLTQ